MISKRSLLGIFLCAALVTTAMGSKEQATSEQPTFKATTEFVQVPVIVQRSGKHVPGLSKNDFTLEQDGKSQAIATFEEVHAGAAERVRTTGGFDNTYSAGLTPQQIT